MKLLNKKRRDKTSSEFGEALMTYLGRKADRSIMEYTIFQQSEGVGSVKYSIFCIVFSMFSLLVYVLFKVNVQLCILKIE